MSAANRSTHALRWGDAVRLAPARVFFTESGIFGFRAPLLTFDVFCGSLVAPGFLSGLESVVRMWGPRGEDEAVIGEEEEAAYPDPDSPSLEEIAQSNQGSMNAGKNRIQQARNMKIDPPLVSPCHRSRYYDDSMFLLLCHV